MLTFNHINETYVDVRAKNMNKNLFSTEILHNLCVCLEHESKKKGPPAWTNQQPITQGVAPARPINREGFVLNVQ